MPTVGKYRIVSPTIALFLEDGHHVARTVPAGSIVTIDNVAIDKLVEVTWDGMQVMMFAQDVRTRGEKIE
jgi:hypothetical protein